MMKAWEALDGNLLVAANVQVPGRPMLIDMVLRLQQALDLVRGGIELHPLFVRRLRDTVRRNPGRLDPLTDRVDGVLSRGKDIDDLLRRVVFPELRGLRMGPVRVN